MKWLACLITGLVLAPGIAWAQVAEDAEFDYRLIEEVEQSNRALAKSKERLVQTLHGYRDELNQLRSDCEEFRTELNILTEFVDQQQTQFAEVRQQMSALYKQNIEYVRRLAKLQWQQAESITLPENTR